ncbi:MAG: LuxR C-terminal-related transcriptional regulator [Prochlorococcaceae cyanobacterium]
MILEDQGLLADLLRQDLDRIPGLSVVGVGRSVEEGRYLCRKRRPDLLLMDLLLPDGQGVDVAEHLLLEKPTAQVVVLSAQCERLSCSRRLHAAILAVVDKGTAIDTLHLILQREVLRERSSGQQDDPFGALTERERQVLALIGQGLSSLEIAARLNISLLTARTHRRNITAKLGFTGAELVLLASGRLPAQA